MLCTLIHNKLYSTQTQLRELHIICVGIFPIEENILLFS